MSNGCGTADRRASSLQRRDVGSPDQRAIVSGLTPATALLFGRVPRQRRPMPHAQRNGARKGIGEYPDVGKRREIFRASGPSAAQRSVMRCCTRFSTNQRVRIAARFRPVDKRPSVLGQLPFVLEEVVEEVIAPRRRRLRPGDFGTARDRVRADAGAEFALPAETLILERAGFRLRADQRRIARRCGLCRTQDRRRSAPPFLRRSSPCGRRSRECLSPPRSDPLTVRPFRIDVDQAHLHRAERLLKLALAAIALVAEPRLPPQ